MQFFTKQRIYFYFFFLYAIFSGCMSDGKKSKKITPIVPEPGSFIVDTIPYGEYDILAPGRGANTFYTYNQAINVPEPDTSIWSLDNETRFNWGELQLTSAGQYDWSSFDDQINYSIDRNQRFSFGIVPVADGDKGTQIVDSGIIGYPLFVHKAMQSESVKDWKYNNMWVPNWNSESWLRSFEVFLKALADHIEKTTYKNISYKNVVYKIDIRGFGHWGEWHTWPWRDCGCTPVDTKPAAATLKRIIDAHIHAFPDYPLIGNVDMFYSEIPAEIGYYVLTVSNNWGKIGFRSDHLGDASTFKAEMNDTRSYKGLVFSKELALRWQYAPLTGEPLNNASTVLAGGNCHFWDLENEVRRLHISQFNNQNGTGISSLCLQDNYRSASKASGYRLQVKSGSVTNTGNGLIVALNWSNSGIAPVYENWDVWFELRDSSKVVWSGKSSFHPKLFLPGSQIITDSFPPPSKNNLSLHLVVRDPTGYRKPLPLANKNRASDGSYLISTSVIEPIKSKK